MKAPMCKGESSSCFAQENLLRGTAAMPDDNREPNSIDPEGGQWSSNTIDGCQDGTKAAVYGDDESIDVLGIVSLDPKTNQPWDQPLRVGGMASIAVRVHAFLNSGDPSGDYLDFWYSNSTDANSLNWRSLGTTRLAVGDVDSNGFGNFTSEPFVILEGESTQAIRVNIRYKEVQSECTGGANWAETDDVTFVVAPRVPPTAPPTSPVSMIHVAVAHCFCLSSHIVQPYYLSCALANFEPNEVPYEQSYHCTVEQRKFAVWYFFEYARNSKTYSNLPPFPAN